MNISNSKILVTGADGFIGSHLVERLVLSGYTVRALVNYNSLGSWGWLDTCDEKILNNIDVVMGDIRDRSFVRESVRDQNIVLHLAALISIPYSYHAPNAYVDTNLIGTMNVLDAARDQEIDRVVCTSTSEVYGTAQFVPITEEHPINAQSPYAATKVAADQMALSYHRSFETPVSIIRPFNTFGPRQSTRAVIPAIISQIVSGKDVISLGNLDASRDFTYVEDSAIGFIQVAETDACVGDVVNIGSGFDITIKDLVEMIIDISGRNVKVEQDQKRMRPKESEVDRLHAGIDKARKLFNWNPEHGGGLEGFRKGIEKTFAWFTLPDNLKHYPSDKFHL